MIHTFSNMKQMDIDDLVLLESMAFLVLNLHFLYGDGFFFI